MAVLIKSRPWGAIKPGYGYRVNRGHPLARGLMNNMLLNEQAGLYVVDSAANQQGYPVSITSGTSTPQAIPIGRHFNGSVTGTTPEQIQSDIGNGQQSGFNNFPRTFDAIIRVAGNTQGAVMGLWNSDINTNGAQCRGIAMGIGNTQMDNSGTTLLALNENVAWHSSGATIPTNQLVRISFVYPGPTLVSSFYINGRLAGTATLAAVSGGTSTAQIRLMVGGYVTQATNRVFTGDIITARHWQRVLNANEMAWLQAEPYAFMQQGKVIIPDSVVANSWHTSLVKVWQ